MGHEAPEDTSYLAFHSNEVERLGKASSSVTWMRENTGKKRGFLQNMSQNPFLFFMLGFALVISFSWWILDELIPDGALLGGRRFEVTAFYFDGSAYVTLDSSLEPNTYGAREYELILSFDSGTSETFHLLAVDKRQAFYYTVKTPESKKVTVNLRQETGTVSFSIPVERGK